jgi:hypothetical protein
VCDKNNKSVEIGNVQMMIDNIDEDGILHGGFGIQVNDISHDNNNFESTRRNLMYVDNSGTLFINKINLGGKIIEVDANGDLLYNGIKLD